MIKYGCQTYSWQMSGATYRGRVRHMAGAAATAGFQGLEPEVVMLGSYHDPSTMRSALDEARIELISIVLVEDWAGPGETADEQANADYFIDYVRQFPSAVLVLCQMPGANRNQLHERQRNVLTCISAVSQRAADQGVRCTFHPNSPAGSVFRTPDDYQLLLEKLTSTVGLTADVGHIAKGGMDPLELIRTYRPRIDHIHFKDIDDHGCWAPTGKGTIDFPAITHFLHNSGYQGWIVLEDESPAARDNPDDAVRRNGDYIEQVLRPLYGNS